MDHERSAKQERVITQDSTHARRASACASPASPDVSRAIPQDKALQCQRDSSSRETSSSLHHEYAHHILATSAIAAPTTASPKAHLHHMQASTSTTDLDEDDIPGEILSLIMRVIDPGGPEAANAFEKADEKPPITSDSLAELDMPRIINNPKLRHDVNFDRELHFRPNLDGSKGRQKIHQTELYWQASETEIIMHNYALTQKLLNPKREVYWTRVSKAVLVRLPKVFAAIRDILKTLVPDYDQKAVKERLDVDHIMQEILNGVCDLMDLANWLSKILKSHCAPMRDALVDSMRAEIAQGAEHNNPKQLVEGLRLLMNILESMKLDVANHQIRHMRPLLVDDTVNFQRRYNAHRIAIGKLCPQTARTWIRSQLQPYGSEPTAQLAMTRALIIDLVYEDSSAFCPPVFYLDSDRLRALRTELHSRIYHSICRDVLRLFSWLTVRESDLTTLTMSIAAIVGTQAKFAEKMQNIAVEIVRVLLSAEGRNPPIDADLLIVVEQRLSQCLRQDCHEFREHAMNLAERLIPKVQSSVEDYAKTTAITLQDTLVPQVPSPKHSTLGFGAHCEPAPAPTSLFAGDPDADLIKRFTHILVLHWQVWSPLVYLSAGEDQDGDNDSDNGSDSTIVQSRTASPTVVPIATAVYAPDRKWPPVSVTVTDVPAGLPTPSPSPKPEDGSPSTNNEQAEDHFDTKNRQIA